MKILFLCTGNSCRSQMAEGWARHLHGGRLEVSSAGTRPERLDARAVVVMAEAGIDIGQGQPKSIDQLPDADFDLVITVCDAASESCPVFPGATKIIHHGFDDPPRLAASATSEDEALTHYRRVREEIGSFIESLPDRVTIPEVPRT